MSLLNAMDKWSVFGSRGCQITSNWLSFFWAARPIPSQLLFCLLGGMRAGAFRVLSGAASRTLPGLFLDKSFFCINTFPYNSCPSSISIQNSCHYTCKSLAHCSWAFLPPSTTPRVSSCRISSASVLPTSYFSEPGIHRYHHPTLHSVWQDARTQVLASDGHARMDCWPEWSFKTRYSRRPLISFPCLLAIENVH